MAETTNYKFPIPTLSGVADISLVGDAIEDIDSTIKSVSDVAGGKAPENHASISDTYGLANATNYGHVRLSDNTTSNATATAGVAATPAAVKAAFDRATAAGESNKFSTTKKEIGTWVLGQSIWRIPVNITNAKTNDYVVLNSGNSSMLFDIDAYLGYFDVGSSDYKVFSVNLVCNDAGDNYCYTPLYMNMKAAYFADSEHPQCYQQINSFGGSIIGYIDVVDMS